MVSPYINRFLQPDSIIPDLSNPQSWNRYSYVTNRPVNFNDPSGHREIEGCGDDGKGSCVETDPQKIADNVQKVETLKHKAKEKQCRNGNFAKCGGYQGVQLQFTLTAGLPTQLQDEKGQNVDPILFFGISFVFDKHGGFQIYTLRRDIQFTPDYTPGVAESAYPSEYAGASISAAVGTIGGTGFAANGTAAYEGQAVDYILGALDHYEMVDDTGEADLTRLYGDDIALFGAGSPSAGQLATYAEPFFNMPRIGLPIRDPYDY